MFLERINKFYYHWKRSNWILFYPFYYLTKLNNFEKIYNPIFLLGNQGDGLTLMSRVLRRNKSVVSVTGNYKYWAGADEMQNVYEPILPPDLSGMRFKAPKHPRLTPPRSWSYACDEMLSYYRRTEQDANPYAEKRLKQAILLAISLHGKGIKNPRFIDKSQTYSLKMSYIYKLLEEHNPYFIHITRNPYATIYRAALGKAGDMKRYAKFMDIDERVQICMQHWLNTAKCIEEDKNKVSNYLRVKFEDLLADPEKIVKSLCNFAELEYNPDMLPHPHHRLPFGIKYEERWYPLRPDINEPYLNQIPQKFVDMIYDKCGKYAELYGYDKP